MAVLLEHYEYPYVDLDVGLYEGKMIVDGSDSVEALEKALEIYPNLKA